MKLDDKAVEIVAKAISDGLHVTSEFGVPFGPEMCPDCGVEAVVVFPLTCITKDGVHADAGHVRACQVCEPVEDE